MVGKGLERWYFAHCRSCGRELGRAVSRRRAKRKGVEALRDHDCSRPDAEIPR
jgi:hypothetical protein